VKTKRTILGISLVCLLVLCYYAFFGIRTARIETLQSAISQNLKQGTSSAKVRSFLDAQHLDPSNLMKPEILTYGRGRDYSNQNVVVAVKRNTRLSLLYDESIYLVFVFNDNDELIRWDVFPIYTGL
jgi:hypothetical protein